MLENAGKENNLDEETKTSAPKVSLKPKVKAREFGRELTNTAETAALKEKRAKATSRAAKAPNKSSKVTKLTEHLGSLTLASPTPSLSGKDLYSLNGDELKEAILEEMSLRRKKVRDEIPDYDMFRI